MSKGRKMARGENWFKHDVDSRLVPSMQLFISKVGAEGYGFFWAVIEEMYRTNKPEQTLTSANKVGQNLQIPKERILFILDAAVEMGLWEQRGDILYSKRADLEIQKTEEKRKNISELRAAAGQKSGQARKSKTNKREQNEQNALDKSREDKKREDVDKNIISVGIATSNSEKVKHGSYVYLSKLEFDTFLESQGEALLKRAIDRLDGWIGQDPSPARIRSGQNAASALKAWALQRAKEDLTKKAVVSNGHNRKLSPAQKTWETAQALLLKEAQKGKI